MSTQRYSSRPQRAGGKTKHITDLGGLKANARMQCLPEFLLVGPMPTDGDLLEGRRRLMVLRIKQWLEVL